METTLHTHTHKHISYNTTEFGEEDDDDDDENTLHPMEINKREKFR